LIKKRQGQGARSSKNTESRQGGMNSCPFGYVMRRANAGARCWEPTVTTEGSNCNPSFLYYNDLQSA